MEETPGARFLLMAACLVVVVWGLRLGAPILIPFSLALFLAVLSLPVLRALQDRGVPPVLAVALTVLVDIGVFGLLFLLATQSALAFQEAVPRYAARLQGLWQEWIAALEARGIPAGTYVSTRVVNPDAVVDLAGTTLGRAAAFVSNTFLVLLVLVFILGEATVFPAKFRAILGRAGTDAGQMAKITREVQEYLGIKTVVSLATGLSIGLWAWIMGVDFPVLLGILGFLFNYIPTIGSIIAAVPAVLLALIDAGPGHAGLVALGYVVINTVFGNLIEPSLLGRRLGLSTLVVILSLLFWGWVWGPVGALMAVPLTMVLKIMLENTRDLRWVAVLLDKNPPEPAAPAPAGPPDDGRGPAAEA